LIVDSSALVAIALDEPGREALVAKIDEAERVVIAAPTLVEAGIVMSARTGSDAGELLAELVAAADAIVLEFGAAHWQEAIAAWWRFGKSRHAASLDFGDCLAYAAARISGEPLLAKEDDFAKTDVALA
jgi:ribonuclease VapC